METKPHWSPDADYASCPFLIRRMDTVSYYKPAEAPSILPNPKPLLSLGRILITRPISS